MSENSSDDEDDGKRLRISDFDQDCDQIVPSLKSPAALSKEKEIIFQTREDIHLIESKKRAQLSENFKEVAKSNQLLSKVKLQSTEDLKYYEGYQTSLVCNQNDVSIQDLLVHSESKEKRLMKL